MCDCDDNDGGSLSEFDYVQDSKESVSDNNCSGVTVRLFGMTTKSIIVIIVLMIVIKDGDNFQFNAH